MNKITLKGIYGNECSIYGTILGQVEHGYNTINGGWSLNKINEGDTIATFIKFQKKFKRKISYINKRNILRID